VNRNKVFDYGRNNKNIAKEKIRIGDRRMTGASNRNSGTITNGDGRIGRGKTS
jgi:hypothetical protein